VTAMQPHKPTREQKRSALISALVLGALVLGIYGVFMLKVLSA